MRTLLPPRDHDATTAAARDLDQVRRALGYGTINVYGPSSAVTMGLAYLQPGLPARRHHRLHPGRAARQPGALEQLHPRPGPGARAIPGTIGTMTSGSNPSA